MHQLRVRSLGSLLVPSCQFGGYAAGLPEKWKPRGYAPEHNVLGNTRSTRKSGASVFTAKTRREVRLNPSETDLPRLCEAGALSPIGERPMCPMCRMCPLLFAVTRCQEGF